MVSVLFCFSFISFILSPFVSGLCVLPFLAFQVEALFQKKAGQIKKKPKPHKIKYSV